MKTYYSYVVAAILLLAACDPLGFESTPNLNSDGAPSGTYTITLADGTSFFACNSTTWQLNAGNTFKNAGSVNVANDNEFLYVTVNSTYGFQNVSENLKIMVATSLDLIPSVPGQFSWKTTVAQGTNEYTFKIPFSEIEAYTGAATTCSSKIYVFVHGDVISDSNGGTDTAWGGDICHNSGAGAGNWGCYGYYQAKCCTTPPPPPGECTETAFAKGGYVFTTDPKSNPEHLPSLNLTKNRWGWAINLTTTVQTTYDIWAGAGLNYTSKGTKVGTLTVLRNGTSVTVTYTLLPGFNLESVHVYAGDFKPTTIAPGQYGNIESFDGNVSTYTNTYNVSDSNGDGIWIIAHAGVLCDCK